MENGTLVATPALAGRPTFRLRASSVVAALALVFAMFALVQNRADAAPATAAVTASVGSAATVHAQFGGGGIGLDFRSLFCSILIAIRNAFRSTPFFNFVVPILNNLIVGFGCSPS